MKSLGSVFVTMALALSGTAAFAQNSSQTTVCGKVQVVEYKGDVSVNIADLRSYAGKQVNFEVMNSSDLNWKALENNCVCAVGEVSVEPDMGSSLYMRIVVSRIASVDKTGKSCERIK